LQYKAAKYISKADTVDLTLLDEYKEISQDLYGEKIEEKAAVAMATVVGKVFNKKTSKPFANLLPFVIQVDKIPYPFFEVTTATGEYKLIVPLSDTYTINARATGYYPVFEILDIKNEKSGIKIFKDLVIAPIEVGVAVRMNNIFFQSGKSILDPKSFPELDKLAKFLIDNPGIVVEIGGHTDNVGKADKNMLLSRWRARAVEQYLEGKGANKDKVIFNGYGSTKPVAENKTAKGKAQNRRVEFVIKSID
jgi:outer membrane protein OmpA-like peptidoglycan-associated protein